MSTPCDRAGGWRRWSPSSSWWPFGAVLFGFAGHFRRGVRNRGSPGQGRLLGQLLSDAGQQAGLCSTEFGPQSVEGLGRPLLDSVLNRASSTSRRRITARVSSRSRSATTGAGGISLPLAVAALQKPRLPGLCHSKNLAVCIWLSSHSKKVGVSIAFNSTRCPWRCRSSSSRGGLPSRWPGGSPPR